MGETKPALVVPAKSTSIATASLIDRPNRRAAWQFPAGTPTLNRLTGNGAGKAMADNTLINAISDWLIEEALGEPDMIGKGHGTIFIAERLAALFDEGPLWSRPIRIRIISVRLRHTKKRDSLNSVLPSGTSGA